VAEFYEAPANPLSPQRHGGMTPQEIVLIAVLAASAVALATVLLWLF
jgi:hypothetical protein